VKGGDVIGGSSSIKLYISVCGIYILSWNGLAFLICDYQKKKREEILSLKSKTEEVNGFFGA
jgi:hypothetical protein